MENMPLYTNMCKAIRECHSIDEIDTIVQAGNIEKAITLYTDQYSDRVTRDLFKQIYLRAARRKGELQKSLDINNKNGGGVSVTKSERVRINENIRISNIPEQEFEAQVNLPGASKRKLLEYASKSSRPKPEPEYINRIDPETLAKIEHRQKLTKITSSIHQIRLALTRAVEGYNIMRYTIKQIPNYSEEQFTDGMYNDLHHIAKALRELKDLLNVSDTRNIPLVRSK